MQHNYLWPILKKNLVITFDLACSLFSLYLASYLKFGQNILFNDEYISSFQVALFVLLQMATFLACGLYKGIWRFSSIHDLYRVIKGVSMGVLTITLFSFYFNRAEELPRTLFIIDWFILLVLVGGGRFAYRFMVDFRFNIQGDNVIIFGANQTGEQLLREILHTPQMNLKVVAFIDQDIEKKNALIHGVPIRGNLSELRKVCQKHDVKKIIVTLPNTDPNNIKEIIKCSNEFDIDISILPSWRDRMGGKGLLFQARKLSYEDFLGRSPVNLDHGQITKLIEGKRVFITGAGGSIGQILTEQILKFMPSELILLDCCEYNLFSLQKILSKNKSSSKIFYYLGGLLDSKRLNFIIEKHLPELVYHAAAYKHVGILEDNPYEAIKNNVLGIKNLIQSLSKIKFERFVLVSTDKAVNPTSIMGASKRMAEMYCQYANTLNTEAKYMTVRFGNVLGSSGSVIPLFEKQIENGGPITVTHPDVSRYFMSIPEACQLVLQASALGRGNEIFILDMGTPIRIYDLAKQMIRLSNKAQDEIKIIFTGLGPGEKLHEELLGTDENPMPTPHKKVKITKHRPLPLDFIHIFNDIISITPEVTRNSLDDMIRKIIPELNEMNFLAPQILAKDLENQEKEIEQNIN